MLDQLPVELTVRWLEEIDQIAQLLTCRLVCRRLHDIIDQTEALQYRISLSRYGFRDVITNGRVRLSDRMRMLNKYITAWRDPRLSPARNQPSCRLLESYGTTYELQGGLFVRGRALANSSVWDTRELNYTELPWKDWRAEGEPVYFSGQENGWSTKDLGLDVRDFQIDPSQDLAILVQKLQVTPNGCFLLVHMRTISDNLPHPESPCPVFPVPLPLPEEGLTISIDWLTIQIMDDLVGVLSCWQEFDELENSPEWIVMNSNVRGYATLIYND
ncbi:hypothetical protein FRB99_007905 [Tulasnella sp. 403]|nr:hypothetical protein FRB99_007905 [Tulasnella sp. 403]